MTNGEKESSLAHLKQFELSNKTARDKLRSFLVCALCVCLEAMLSDDLCLIPSLSDALISSEIGGYEKPWQHTAEGSTPLASRLRPVA
jgi:hypothetical protein